MLPDLDQVIARLRDPWFRLDALYHVVDEHGKHTPFTMTAEQRQVLKAILDGKLRLVILKARSVGMTTFCAILALDCCLFEPNLRAGIVDKNLPDARSILKKKIAYAYRYLPPAIQAMAPMKGNKGTLEFGNGSSIEVGTSLRGGVYQFVHITELGKIARRFPEKAEEIKTGTLQTVHAGNIIIIESTAEGRGGLFDETWQLAEQTRSLPPERVSSSDWHGLFFAWWQDRKYRSSKPYDITPDLDAYFAEMEAKHDIVTDDQQRWWYARKAHQLGAKMKEQFPSTPKEAFSGSAAGTYYAAALDAIEAKGQIGRVPFNPDWPVWSIWDLGLSDQMSIWLFQEPPNSGWRHYLAYLEDSGHDIEHYLRKLEDLGRERGYRWNGHVLPHDGNQRSLRDGKTFSNYVRTLEPLYPDLNLGRTADAERDHSLDHAIQMVRQQLRYARFDAEGCKLGLQRLRNYSQRWDISTSSWSGTPRHDVNSHGADAFRTGVWLPEELLAA